MDKKKRNEHLPDAALNNVTGGAPHFIRTDTKCPHCGQWVFPVWSNELNMYICEKSNCRKPLPQVAKFEVQVVP